VRAHEPIQKRKDKNGDTDDKANVEHCDDESAWHMFLRVLCGFVDGGVTTSVSGGSQPPLTVELQLT
jgi:hypothetical protein